MYFFYTFIDYQVCTYSRFRVGCRSKPTSSIQPVNRHHNAGRPGGLVVTPERYVLLILIDSFCSSRTSRGSDF